MKTTWKIRKRKKKKIKRRCSWLVIVSVVPRRVDPGDRWNVYKSSSIGAGVTARS